MDKPRIGITLGDPGGIGPEVVFKALAKLKYKAQIFLFGSKEILKDQYYKLYLDGLPLIENELNKNEKIKFIDVYKFENQIIKGSPQAQNGKASYEYIYKALEFLRDDKLDGLVTAPICKESWAMAGIDYTGHTDMLADLTKSKQVSMGFYTEKLKTILVTIHKPLREVPDLINDEVLAIALKNTKIFADKLNMQSPKIAMAGLNPHAGEHGVMGKEENEILRPFCEKNNVLGPFPADTIYNRAINKEFDIVISMYHDQALIPIKLLGFFEAVNVTLGLPFIRTSPDHGTAFEIVEQNIADEKSMISAFELVYKMIN